MAQSDVRIEPAERDSSGTRRIARSARAGPTARWAPRPARRQAQLTLRRVEPWSVMKNSFVASIAAFAVLLAAVAILRPVLSATGLLGWLQNTATTIFTSGKPADARRVASWFSASRIIEYAAILGAVNIVLITVLTTLGAVIYNQIARTLGGIAGSLSETD